MTVEMISEILENELRNAVEVKDSQSLHRYISYLSNQLVERNETVLKNDTEHASFREAVLKMDSKTDALIIETREGFKLMDERFKSMDERFKAMDERFKAMDKRFTAVQWSLGMGFIVISLLITLMQYLN